MESVRLFLGKCENILKQFESNSIDAMVTDPPAGIAFMNKDWDKDHGGRDQWIEYMTGIFGECLRVLKPGSHSLIWALPRTSHWTATALENAGFEIRDSILHLFGSGFPKSLNIGKAIDKLQENRRIDLGFNPNSRPNQEGKQPLTISGKFTYKNLTRGNSPFEGFGTALKPACEHWILCRKPISEKNIAENVLKWGCGGLNIDVCRIDYINNLDLKQAEAKSRVTNKRNQQICKNHIFSKNEVQNNFNINKGRFPSNVIHDGSEEVLAEFPSPHGAGIKRNILSGCNNNYMGRGKNSGIRFGDSGSAARFFYCAKASKRDRDEGLDEFFWYKKNHNSKWQRISQKEYFRLKEENDIAKENGEKPKHIINTGNIHETVKATPLMRYLCRLITPPDGTIVDPFMGSGSTGKAAILEGFGFCGIENEKDYFDISEARNNFVKNKRENQYKLAI